MSANGIVHKRVAGGSLPSESLTGNISNGPTHGTLPLLVGNRTRRKILNKKDQHWIFSSQRRNKFLAVGSTFLFFVSLMNYFGFDDYLFPIIGWNMNVVLRTRSRSRQNSGNNNTPGQVQVGDTKDATLDEEGDKSEEYALLRREYDALLPVTDIARMKDFVQSLKKNTYSTARPQDLSYDIYNCPDEPPDDYPLAWNVLTVLKNWEIDDPTPREQIYQGVCVFDYDRDYDKALNYQNAEVPFVVQNDPRVLRTVERWNQPDYLHKLLGDRDYMAEYSATNHFLYWNSPKDGKAMKRLGKKFKKDAEKWKPPTERIRMTYTDWLSHANTTTLVGAGMEHWYFRLIGCGIGLGADCEKHPAEFLFDELDFFRGIHSTEELSVSSSSLYIVDPKGQQGIHCRFGMRGVIAENHWDSTRNAIVVLGGERRYLLSHPGQCKNLELYPEGHPSARHSAVDWSKPNLEAYPNFRHAEVNEVVLQAGDVLYLPTNWFHHIVSLELNYQCNTRSGRTKTYDKDIADCNFKHM